MARARLASLHLVVLLVIACPALGQNVPLKALDNWMWHDEQGWKDLERRWYDRAEQHFRLAVREIEAYSPGNRNLMAKTYNGLARALYYQQRFADAEPLAKWALSVRDANKKSSPDLVFQSLFTLASIQSAQEHYADAEPVFKRALALQEKELSPSHVNTLLTLERLALVLRSEGKYHEADPLYRRAIAIHERKTPDENLELAGLIDQYVILLRKMNRKDEAEQWENRSLRIKDTAATNAARAKNDQLSKRLQGFK
jgi:hypothetical protein